MVLGLAVIFWTTAGLGRTALGCVPWPLLPPLWRNELGFVVMMALWWRVYPTMMGARPFWMGALLALAAEGALLWVQRARCRRMAYREILRLGR